MEPTYPSGDDVTVRSVDGSAVRRGEVVLFSAHDWGVDGVFLMRVTAVGGDHVAIDETGKVSVNGKTLREPYVAEHGGFSSPVDVTVPANRLFLLGDHRDIAADSRAHVSEDGGSIARSAVVGVAVDRASVPSPDRSWMWVGAATAAAGLVAAAALAVIGRRRSA
jgi:signal peptidase I